MRFADAVRVYDVAATATATRETVAAPLARRFAGEVRRMSRTIDDFDGDELWNAVIRRLRRILRELASTPLPPTSPVLGLAGSVDYLAVLTARARGNYPEDLVARADLCVAALTDLSRDTANPFGELVAEILHTGDLASSGLLVKSPHLEAVRRWLSGAAPRVRLLTEGEVTRLAGMESLVVAGPSYWFPPHVLSAPRAEAISFVHYDFLRDQERGTRLFTGSHGSPGTTVRSPLTAPHPVDDELDVELLTPTVDWEALARASGGRRRSDDHDVEAVSANLFLLADGYSVYLEAVDGPRIEVVADLESESLPRLRSERTSAIGPGDFIVLRSEGGSGDYIPTVADALLGNRAGSLRAAQASWKDALRAKVRERGFSSVERELHMLGVSSPNLRYRLWRNSLRSRNPNDFRVLMEYIGLGNQAEMLWTAMSEISVAHRHAGHDVRKLLEDAVLATDPDKLIHTGRVDVRLAEMDAGTLSVLRVEGRAPETVMVDEDDLRSMTRVEPDLWQG